MTPSDPPLPDFVIIGAQKSATRWLRTNLGEHPEIFAAPFEVSFFNQRYHRGVDYYRSQFEGWSGESLVGEATPGYMVWRHRPKVMARRINDTVPDARLIAVLRNPIDRAQSAMVHHIKAGRLPEGSQLTDLVRQQAPEDDRLGLVAGGWYAASLEPYKDRFGDRLLFLMHDEVSSDPRGVYSRALEHIGASPDFVPPDIDAVIFSNQAKADGPPALSDDDRLLLWDFFEHDVRQLELMIGRDLSAWDPTPGRVRWPVDGPDLLPIYDRVTAWLGALMSKVSPDQYSDPTPCRGWDVRDLLIHVISHIMSTTGNLAHGALDLHPEEGAEQMLRVDIARRLPGLPAKDLRAVTDGFAIDPTASFKKGTAELRTYIASSPRLQLTVPGSKPPMPIAVELASYIVNQTAHGWDLAVATGQDPTIPAQLAADADKVAEILFTNAPSVRRLIGPEVAPRRSADTAARFLARMGRRRTRSALKV